MSRLLQLITELCPSGVPLRPIGDVITDLRTGLNPRSNFVLNPPGANCYYVTVRELAGSDVQFCEKTDRIDSAAVQVIDKRARLQVGDVLFSSTGTIGRTALVNAALSDWNVNEGIYVLTPDPQSVLSRYLLRILQSRNTASRLRRITSGSTILHVSMADLRRISIPVPPLEVQREIVLVLDAFAALEAELEAELEARRLQYAHYRDRLLTFPEGGVRWTTLGDVCIKVVSGGTPSSGRAEYYGGSIPWLRTQEVDYADISATGMTITEEGMRGSSAKWIPANCVIVAMYGATAAKTAVNAIPLTTNQACCNLQVDAEQAEYRYVFHWVSNEYRRLRALGEGSQANLSAQKVKAYPIPVPPLERQREIVAVLDRFDALVNDCSIGLSAELAARRKQYEYYRDRLLAFEEAVA